MKKNYKGINYEYTDELKKCLESKGIDVDAELDKAIEMIYQEEMKRTEHNE